MKLFQILDMGKVLTLATKKGVYRFGGCHDVFPHSFRMSFDISGCQGGESPFVKCKALWAGVFVEGVEAEDELCLSERDTDLPSTSEAPSEP